MHAHRSVVAVALAVALVGCRVAGTPDAKAPGQGSEASRPSAGDPVSPAPPKEDATTPAQSDGEVFVAADDGELADPMAPKTVKARGTVSRIELEGGFWGIVSDGGEKYDPRNLPKEFQEDGLRVRFEGHLVGDVSFHMWGQGLSITKIEKD